MKKLLSAFLIVAAFATAFSCSKIEEVKPVAGEVHTVSFNAISPTTRTTFGTLSAGKFPTYWTVNDSEVKVAQNFSNGINAALTRNSDTNASFTAQFEDDGSGDYTFYAVSPASAVVSGVNTTYYSWNLEIPTTQTTTATGPDESAMIMAATSSSSGSFPANVNLSFKHITAYVHMNITNLDLAVGDEVASVLVTADANIAYRYYYYVGGAKAGTLEESNGQTSITILTNHADNIWFACAPMASGTELTISVTTTNSKVYTKVINTPAALAAGHVASFDVDFAGITPPSDKVYNLVTSYSEFTAGSKVIIAAIGSTNFAAGIATTDGSYVSQVSQSKTNSYTQIINPAATVDVFTIGNGNASNTISLYGTNGYLSAKSGGNNMNANATLTNDGSWVPFIKDDLTGEILLKNVGTTKPYMRYNGGASRFSCYDTEGTNVALYKLEGSGSGPSLIPSYTVTYNGNGNTGGTAPSSVVTSGPFTVAAAGTLTKTDCIFIGWNTEANGSGTSYVAGASAVATGNLTLYAQWSSKTKVYELTPAKSTTNTTYASTYDVEIDEMIWNAPGNQNFEGFWRIGGKSLTNAERIIYAKSNMDGDCDEIVIATNGVSNTNLTISSITVVAYPTAGDLSAGTNGVSFTTSGTFEFAASTSKSLTFTKSGSTDCDGYRYKIVFTCSNSKSSNYGLDLTGITFYKN